jgi:hypothetical protein
VSGATSVEARVGFEWRFDCWSISAIYINRHHSDSEFRFSVNLLGLGQIGTSLGLGQIGTSARPGL